MLTWIIFIVGLFAIYFFIKMSHFKYKILLALIVLFVLVLSLTFIKVAENNSISINSPSGVFSAVKLYFSWLGNVADNAKVITGNIIKMDWFSVK